MTDEAFCYLTTTGRRSGRPHTIEIWFVREGSTLHLMAGGRDTSDWVRNLVREPAVSVRIAEAIHDGMARVVEEGTDEDVVARAAMLAKYQAPGSTDLASWGRASLVVAIDLA